MSSITSLSSPILTKTHTHTQIWWKKGGWHARTLLSSSVLNEVNLSMLCDTCGCIQQHLTEWLTGLLAARSHLSNRCTQRRSKYEQGRGTIRAESKRLLKEEREDTATATQWRTTWKREKRNLTLGDGDTLWSYEATVILLKTFRGEISVEQQIFELSMNCFTRRESFYCHLVVKLTNLHSATNCDGNIFIPSAMSQLSSEYCIYTWVFYTIYINCSGELIQYSHFCWLYKKKQTLSFYLSSYFYSKWIRIFWISQELQDLRNGRRKKEQNKK